MEEKSLHLLILEDSPDDAELAIKELEREGFSVKWTRVDTEEGFREALSGKHEVILVAYALPNFDGMAAIQMHQQIAPDIPLIIFSGRIGEEVAVGCVKSGATDYVLKDNLSRLAPVVKRALEEAESHREGKRMHERIRHLNHVLKAIRHVNQLIVKEKDRDSLLRKACYSLVDARGYDGVWLGFLGNDKTFATVVGSGLGKDVSRFIEHVIDGDHPPCIEKALDRKDLLMIVDRSKVCRDCFFKSSCIGKEAAIIRVENGDKFYGLLAVLFAPDGLVDDEEKELLKEVAGDIALGLYNMDLEEARKHAEKLLRERTYELGERVKELNCLYGISKVTEKHDISIEKILRETVNLIPPAWHHPEIVCARINIEGQEFRTGKFKETTWKQTSDITVQGERIGAVEVYYLEEKQQIDEGAFLKEERDLIDTIAERLGRIVERKRAEEALREAYNIINRSPAVAFLWKNAEGWPVEFVSDNVRELFGYTKDEFTSGKVSYATTVHPVDLERVAQELKTFSGEEGRIEFNQHEYRIVTKGGEVKWLDDMTFIRRDEKGDITHYEGIVIDISERVKVEEEKKELEANLQQAQKMEAIGTLAGGVAHDFNNILTTIIGNASLALMEIGKDDPLREQIEEIKIAGERAASLTRQLLAFSRKQVFQPVILNLNSVTTNLEKMLRRLIGEDVELETLLEPDLGEVEADPGQIEQVIMNLVVNARDAMPQGGKLTIETANVALDEDYFSDHGVRNPPGPYVMISVSDIGSGMDKETQSHIFEPFFTTKERERGTGLGLSTVYGIVKQSGGFIWAYSEPGQGTTFKVYLPKAAGDERLDKKETTPVDDLTGSETVLIVEDDDRILNLARKILQLRGYTVLAAENGEEALKVSEGHEDPIHLLLTDVVMPVMSGRELAERLQPMRPEIKVIYMSGYTDNAIVHHGVLAPGVNFLEKPFTLESLAKKVRETLDK